MVSSISSSTIANLLGSTTSSQTPDDAISQILTGANETSDPVSISDQAQSLSNSSSTSDSSTNGTSTDSSSLAYYNADILSTENQELVSSLVSNNSGSSGTSFLSSLSDTQLSNMVYIQDLPLLATYAEKLLQDQQSSSTTSSDSSTTGSSDSASSSSTNSTSTDYFTQAFNDTYPDSLSPEDDSSSSSSGNDTLTDSSSADSTSNNSSTNASSTESTPTDYFVQAFNNIYPDSIS